MKPVVMVNKAIELVSWRIVVLTNIGSRAVRPEVVQNGPSTDLLFSRRPVSMKEASTHEPAIHGVHMAIDHVAGAVGIREVESQEKRVLLGAELFNCFKGSATDKLSGPSEKVSDLLAEVSRCRGMIDVPDGCWMVG